MYYSKYLFKIVIATLPIFIVAQENPNWKKIESFLFRDLNYGGVVSVFACFSSTEKTLEQVMGETSNWNRKDVATQLQKRLKELAKEDQKGVNETINNFKDYNVTSDSLWISNRIFIENLNLKLASQIIDDVKLEHIESTEYLHLLQSNIKDIVTHQDNENFTWGLQKIEIEKAWAHVGGPDKAGLETIVGIMDTGYISDQDLINGSALEDFGWFDPLKGSPDKPVDWNGHGTHVTGTIVGKNGIGVAPAAKFISCRACDNQYGCPRYYIEKCAQNFICPTKNDGTEDCKKVVDVVNISFGTYQVEKTWFDRIVDALITARIVPVVAAGNGGRYCQSLYYPATIKNVFTVSSVTKNDAASEFSSWGPVAGNAYLKPDFVAPGTAIKSAGNPNWHYYSWISGTSSAAAHVTGLVALLRGMDPELGVEPIRKMIKNNCDNLQPHYNIKCNGTLDSEMPNYMHGHGRVNAYKAVKG